MALEERFTTHAGRRLRYLVGGEGPPLVLCHGFIGSAENFETWFERLSSRCHLVIPDLPGCGASEPLAGRCNADSLAAAVEAVIDAEALTDFDLGGLCLGAGVAFAVLARRPQRVGRLVLHTPLLAPQLVRRRFHLQVRTFMAPGIFPAVNWLAHRRVVSDIYKRLMVEGSDVDRTAAEMNFMNQQRAHPATQRAWILQGLRRNDSGVLRNCGIPTLIIVASDDRIVDVERMREVTAPLSNVTLVAISDAGHGWTRQYIERQLDAIEQFLESPAAAVAVR